VVLISGLRLEISTTPALYLLLINHFFTTPLACQNENP
jgi:hypothetical protein